MINFLKKKEEKPFIKFRYKKGCELLPRPNRSSKFMPEWIKKLPRKTPNQPHQAPGTVKRCVPVIDAVSNGFIIPAWTDFLIVVKYGEMTKTNEDGSEEVVDGPHIGWSCSGDAEIDFITKHAWEQVGNDCPVMNYPLGKNLMKFSSPWTVETSEGWSVLIKSPPNHFSNIRLFEGVVDSDAYHRPVNLPFFWDGVEEGEFEFKAGTPLAHVVPFKREIPDIQYDVWDEDKLKQQGILHDSVFVDKYRKFWWHKR